MAPSTEEATASPPPPASAPTAAADGGAAADAAAAAVVVRQGTIADLEVLARFNTDMAKETEGIELPQPTITAGVRAVLEGKAAASYYVVEEAGGQVVAALMITYEWSDWRATNMWWIQSVFVEQSHRKAGHFKRLYAFVRQEAHRQGAGGLRLYADNANVRAQAAYERLGMTSHYKVYEDLFTDY